MSREHIEELVQAIHFIAEGLEKLAMISLDVKKKLTVSWISISNVKKITSGYKSLK